MCKHEVPELLPRERSLLVEHRQAEVFLEGELSLLVGLEGQVMALFHLGQLQLEGRGRRLTPVMIPPVAEQDSADVEKHAGDTSRILHRLFFR